MQLSAMSTCQWYRQLQNNQCQLAHMTIQQEMLQLMIRRMKKQTVPIVCCVNVATLNF